MKLEQNRRLNAEARCRSCLHIFYTHGFANLLALGTVLKYTPGIVSTSENFYRPTIMYCTETRITTALIEPWHLAYCNNLNWNE